MSDGWRGTRLGYAGGRTGYMANYGNNDALRGTRGIGASGNFANLRMNRDTTTMMVTAVGLISGLYMLAEYRGRNKLVKTLKNVTKPVHKPARAVAQTTGVDRVLG